jgi:hypothetical protein
LLLPGRRSAPDDFIVANARCGAETQLAKKSERVNKNEVGNAMNRLGRLLRGYYLATPVFMALDGIWGADLRVSFLDGAPHLKYGYYAACLALGIVMLRAPGMAPVATLLESGLNVLMLSLSVMLPYYRAIDAVAAGQPAAAPFDLYTVLNCVLCSAALTAGVYARRPEPA